MTTCQIHVSNVLQVNPGPIQCMSLNENTFKLALFRGGSEPAIELWDVKHLPFKECRLTNLEKVDGIASVESLVWVKDRLFSCGLHGFILEHDLSTGLIKIKTAATSGPVWCLGASPNEEFLAAGTEDGFVNIFQVYDEELMYLKVLDRQEGRHLCLSWSPCGNYIATGSIDSHRLWDVEKGHAIHRFMTTRSKKAETIVWSILLLDDFQIITGDSRGIIGIWDGSVGVLVHQINSHKADVLCLKLSTDKCSIYAAGVDPTVVLLSRYGRNGDKWAKSHQRNMHTNDVMCLATHGNKLYSGGIDADLVVSSFPPKVVNKYPPLPRTDHVGFSKESKHILVQNDRGIDIWRLPGADEDLVKLLELGSRRQDVINSSCMSPSGNYIAYSTQDKINFFRLSTNDGSPDSTIQPKLTKLSSQASDSEKMDNLLLSSLHFMNETLVLGVSTSSLLFLQIDNETDTFVEKAMHPMKSEWTEGNMISLVGTSYVKNSFFVALANSGNSISVLKFHEDDLSMDSGCIRRVPRHHCQPTALAFHPTLHYITIAYSDHSVKVFNYFTGKILHDSLLGKHGVWTPSSQPILGITWSPKGDRIVLHEIDKLYLMKLMECPDTLVAPKKKSKRNTLDKQTALGLEESKLSFEVQTCDNKYKFISFVDYLTEDGNELVVVEVKPSSLLEKLPPVFAKKRFGM